MTGPQCMGSRGLPEIESAATTSSVVTRDTVGLASPVLWAGSDTPRVRASIRKAAAMAAASSKTDDEVFQITGTHHCTAAK